MITVTFESYCKLNEFIGVVAETYEPIIGTKQKLVHKTEYYFDDTADAYDVLSVIKKLCETQKFNIGEHLKFVDFKKTDDGFTYKTESVSFAYKTSVVGWDNWRKKVSFEYVVKHVVYDELGNSTVTTYKYHDMANHIKKVHELCSDYEWELDETVVGFPITYCTQGGVTASFDYHGLE